MGFVSHLQCVVCGATTAAPESAGTCGSCADSSATLEVCYDMTRVANSMTPAALAGRPADQWRYRELLPVGPDDPNHHWPVGCTPIIPTPRLAGWAGVERLRLEDEGRHPTASFKDRASSVGVLHALRAGATRIACASTGNAASSLAGFAAMAGLPATIFVPQRAPAPKLAQLLIFGADLRRVLGTYDQAYEMCNQACAEHGWYNRNCAINPYLIEGKKTCGLEIAEQTATNLPDWVVVSVGDGCTVAAIAKGLLEMQELGFIAKAPKVLGIQAAGADALVRAFTDGTPGPLGAGTLADSIDVAVPRNWRKAVQRIRQTAGAMLTVTDQEITEAMRASGSLAGVFAEPAAAAAIAGVRRAASAGLIAADADVLAVVTGSGLKDTETATRIAGSPTDVEIR